VHRSNFSIEGFTSDVSVERLAFIAAEHGLPVIHDLGSGLLLPLDEYGLSGEPTASVAIAAGPTLVLMSGDKLLGGPQAGIVLGTGAAIAKLRKNPFARAMRVDKLTLSALEATLRLYLEPERALKEVPILAMLTQSVDEIESRCRSIVTSLRSHNVDSEIAPTTASVGGGAFPTAGIPSRAVVLQLDANRTEARLRHGEPAVIGRIAEGKVLLDLRSVLPREDAVLVKAIVQARS
jgi:L-seryl-tRNA(Ser) seleniumtransferase